MTFRDEDKILDQIYASSWKSNFNSRVDFLKNNIQKFIVKEKLNILQIHFEYYYLKKTPNMFVFDIFGRCLHP